MHCMRYRRLATNENHQRQQKLCNGCKYSLVRRRLVESKDTRHLGCVRLEKETDSSIASTTATERTATIGTLYSNLNPRTLAHEPGTIWGATLLVAGTTVGAGILALPAVTQESGFAATSGTLAGCGVFAMATGLLISEVNMNVVARYGISNVTFSTMAEKTLGAAGASAATFLYIFHNYALLVAYVARAGQILATAGNIAPLAGSAMFALGFGGICYATTPRQFDRVNGVLLGMAAAVFVALLVVAGSHIDLPVLARAEWSAVPPTIPVIALAFVYHNIVPVVVHNLECDAAKVRTSIVLGVLIPAAMYLLWDGVILGSLENLAASAADEVAAKMTASAAATAATAAAAAADAATAAVDAAIRDADDALSASAVATYAAATAATASASAATGESDSLTSSAELTAALDPLVLLQRTGGPVVAPLVEVFSFLAIATSFTGFVLAAVDFLPDAFKPLSAVPRSGRYALVVLPPILLSTASPGIFFAALDIAGTYGVMTLYGMMPAAMAWASRYSGDVGDPGRAVSALASTTAGEISSPAGAEEGNGSSVSSSVSGRGVGCDGARVVELVPGGPAVVVLTGAAAAAVIVSQWVI
ncbi:hypothetical protein Vafri_7188 [Volvox africanus]|uniref:Tryptophan/tyrosine permease n=1 Tax=Volvox africanus TaxID=51714 RepID=A0A8J4B0D1_9CHLO|nr:hypothetical protein Vafri_7188 [Volvox africanus]